MEFLSPTRSFHLYAPVRGFVDYAVTLSHTSLRLPANKLMRCQPKVGIDISAQLQKNFVRAYAFGLDREQKIEGQIGMGGRTETMDSRK